MNTKPKLETWKVRTAKGRTHITVADSMVGVPQEVCLIYQCSMTEDRASLIASAPELRRKLVKAQERVRKLEHWLQCIWNDTEGFADGAPDADDHDRMCLHVSAIAKAGLDEAKEVLP